MNIFSSLVSFHQEAVRTALLALTLSCVATGAAWVLSRNQNRETVRFWRLTCRHLAALGFMLGLGVIWKTELQSVLVALGAATAGFLVAFRESWMSLLAFWMRFVRRQYDLHDFIEVDGVRGKVIDITWLYTVVAESVPGKTGTLYSGKVVHIPNNRTLLAPLTVDNLTEEYTLHILTLALPKGAKPLVAERELLAAANDHCAPYFIEARKHMKLLEQEKALEISSVEPKAFLSVGDDSTVTIRVRIIVPEEARSRLTQAILHDFFEKVDDAGWPAG